MDYMKAYEKALNKARNKANGGELSEFEKESIRLELGMDSRKSVNNSIDSTAGFVGLGTKPRLTSDK